MPAPIILAVDTATEVCSVALLRDDSLIERAETVGQRHSERVLPLVDELLREAGVALSEIDAYAFGAGPGSFTGLRIACGIVQGLAYGCERSVVPVGNLRALAAVAFAGGATGDRLLAAIDARMHEAYCAVYQHDEGVTELIAPALALPQQLPEIARRASIQIVAGDALTVFPEVWRSDTDWQRLPDCRASAAAIARLARYELRHGGGIPAAQAAPLYVRDEVALTIEQRQQRKSASVAAQ
jgi:tRNA threonylcarbamoyladenosine biosynthesis protein TsaB